MTSQHQQHDFLKVIFFHEKTTHEDSNIIYSKSNMHSMQKCMYVTERIFPRFPDLQIDCFQVTSKCVCTNHSLSSFSTAFFSMMNSFLFCNSHNKIEKTIFQKVIKENLKISSSSFLLEKLPKEMKKPFFWPIFSLVAERGAV